VPLSRHSTLPELRSFVNLFKPRRVIPNTLDPRLRGLDWLCLDRLFEDVLSPLGATDTIPPTPTDGGDLDLLLVQVDEEGDTAVKNVVGCSDLAHRWADRAKLRNKLEIMVGYLDPERKSFLDKLLRLRPDSPIPELHSSKMQISSPPQGQQRDYDRDSEDGSDGDAAEDDHWRTAHMLFGSTDSAEGEQFKWAFPSPKSPGDIAGSQEQGTEAVLMPELSPIRQIVDNHPSQGQMLHISHQHARTEDRPPMPRPIVVDDYVLDSPIRIQSSARVHSLKFDQHDYSGILESNENTEVPLSTSNNHKTSTKKIRSSLGSQCRPDAPESSSHGVQDENVFIQSPPSATLPDRSASFERPRLGRQTPRRSPRRLVTSTSSPDTSAGAASSGAKTKETPLTIARRRQRVERTLKSLELADRLARANPGKVASAYGQKRARLLKECVRSEVKNQYLEGLEKSRTRNVMPDPHFDRSLSNFETVEGTQMEVDWDRSRQIVEQVRTELATGGWPIFPSLACTESQPPS
jgi:DNA cross-link repair 1C protein